jgi:hypothetical protein
MSNRRIPGYTAETSIYSSAMQYRVGPKEAPTPSVLQPQLRRRPKDDCIPGCICVSPINCPCCDSWWPFPGPTAPVEPSGPF